MSEKVTINTEWLSVCGGCHVAIVDLHEKILDILGAAEIQHCPVLTDIKDFPKAKVGLVSGAVRNEHDKEVAILMRESCDMIIAFGTCAVYGGISGAAMVHSSEEIIKTVYEKNPSTRTDHMPEDAPYKLFERPMPLDEVIDVDLYLPGCPPHASFIFDALLALVKGRKPAANKNSVCARCNRVMSTTDVRDLKRPHHGIPDENLCFLSQGYVCLGSVTLDRCLSPCPQNGIVCAGCSGPTMQILTEPNRDIRTEIADRMVGLTNIGREQILANIERFSKTHYAFSMASNMVRNKPTFLISKWVADMESELQGEPEL